MRVVLCSQASHCIVLHLLSCQLYVRSFKNSFRVYDIFPWTYPRQNTQQGHYTVNEKGNVSGSRMFRWNRWYVQANYQSAVYRPPTDPASIETG